MKVYVVIDENELEAKKVIQGICSNYVDANNLLMSFKEDRFHYDIQEHEVPE